MYRFLFKSFIANGSLTMFFDNLTGTPKTQGALKAPPAHLNFKQIQVL